jgi:hypothetical protein
MLISDSKSAYSFACSLRRRHTISSASCIYIVAELFVKSSSSINQSIINSASAFHERTYTEMVVYRCAASAVSWILIRKKICGPDELYDPGKMELLSVEGGITLMLLLAGITEEGGASVPLDESTFLTLAAREGLRCIFPSKILFCCTSRGSIIINENKS